MIFAPSFVFSLVATLLAVAFAACGSSEPELGGFKLTEFPGHGEPPEVRLIDAGEGPRREMRYRLEAGSTHQMAMTMYMSVAMKMDGRASPSTKTPGVKIPFIIKIAEADDKQFTYEFSVPDDPELIGTEGVQPKLNEAMRNSVRRLPAFRGHVTMTNRGVMKGVDFKLGESASPDLTQMIQSMKQSMEQMSVPLPEEAVGVGAKWKTLQRVHRRGMTLYQVGSFELMRVDGPSMTLGVTVEQFGPKQDLSVPGQPPGMRAELVSTKSKGRSQMTLDLHSPVPSSSGSFKSESVMNFYAEGRVIHTIMNLDMQVQIEQGKPS